MKWNYGWLSPFNTNFNSGLIVGFFLARFFFKRYLEKNPPVNEQMIRVMMQQMGRTPSERQVRQVMASMNQAKPEPAKKKKKRKKKGKE